MPALPRRVLLAAGAAALARPALAAWPDRPIRWVVPFPPGGNTDVMARLCSEALGQALGQPVIIENRPGAASNIGTDYVARAAADGQTLLLGSIANAINQTLYRSIPFDFVTALAPIAPIYSIPNVLTVHPDLPVRDLRALIDFAKAHPGQLNYGSPGSGTTMHLSAELFSRQAGISMTHVPYRGAAQAQQDLIAGRIQLIFDNLPIALPFIRDGRTRALAVTMAGRAPQLPEVPSMAEAGLPLELLVWGGLFAPAATPAPVLDRLNAALRQVLESEAIAARLADLGSLPVDRDRAAFGRFVQAEMGRWGEAVRASGATVD